MRRSAAGVDDPTGCRGVGVPCLHRRDIVGCGERREHDVQEGDLIGGVASTSSGLVAISRRGIRGASGRPARSRR